MNRPDINSIKARCELRKGPRPVGLSREESAKRTVQVLQNYPIMADQDIPALIEYVESLEKAILEADAIMERNSMFPGDRLKFRDMVRGVIK